MRFHVLLLTLNCKSVFSRSDDATSPHSLLCDVTLIKFDWKCCFSSSSRKSNCKKQLPRNIQKQPPEVFRKKNVILKISQNSHENTYTRVSFLIKLQDSDNYLYRCFPVNFAKLFPSLYFELKARKRVLRFQWRHNDASSPKAKIMAGYRQFSTLWHIGNNNQHSNLSQKETPKYLN